MPDSEIGPLTEAAAAGDRGALAVLIEHYLPELRAFVRLRAGPELRRYESQSDLVQTVCREVLANAGKFKFPGEIAFKQWLFTAALRKIGKRWRHYRALKRNRSREAPVRDAAEGDARVVRHYAAFSSPSQHAIANEEMARVEQAFEQLSAEQREVVSLAHLVGMSRAEIAAHTGRTEGAVRVILHRALARLSKLLAE